MTIVPTGFRALRPLDSIIDGYAPVYFRQDGDGLLRLGFHVGPQHCNPRGHCHGGTWATMADVLMGINAGLVTGMGGPTISMTLDYLEAAEVGQWIEGSARVLRQTPRMAFTECLFTADGVAALRANAIFRRKYPVDQTVEGFAETPA